MKFRRRRLSARTKLRIHYIFSPVLLRVVNESSLSPVVQHSESQSHVLNLQLTLHFVPLQPQWRISTRPSSINLLRPVASRILLPFLARKRKADPRSTGIGGTRKSF